MEPDKIKFEQMEVKQEVNEDMVKAEIDNYEVTDPLFNTFKIEINEELKREITNDAFEYSVLNENAVKTEIEQYEGKLTNEKTNDSKQRWFSLRDQLRRALRTKKTVSGQAAPKKKKMEIRR
ncbi:uncharacterized protein [Diabrotica undecimpunctata]|uniref:uncharacterized protein isoform X3 n=1 Tax=Diabrotica undecimpunctata TaxID=50387 RepID=UPI003B632DC2